MTFWKNEKELNEVLIADEYKNSVLCLEYLKLYRWLMMFMFDI